MEDENKFTFRCSRLPKKSYDLFKEMRNGNELCDITLHVGNQTISGHRLIIAAAIPYFRNSFFRKVSGSEENEVDFPDVDPAALGSLLDYAYTCEILITTKNVKNILLGACRLDVEEVREACCNFIVDRLRPETVLQIRNFATYLKCTNLLENIDAYIRENFVDVSKTEEFLNLSLPFVNQLLESDELRADSEEEVFEAVMRWVKKCPEQRKDNLPEMLKLVRMPLLSPIYLKKHVAKEDLIRASVPCWVLLEEIRDFHDFPEERSVCSFSTVPRCSEIPSDVTALKEKRIYTVHGKHVYITKYLENTEKVWNEKRSATVWCNFISTAVVSDKLFLFREGDVISYQPTSNKYEFCAYMPTGRIFAGVTELSEKIYVCGGRSDFSASDIVECYDPKTNKWEKIARMHEGRESPGVATLGKCVYVAGGFNPSVIHRSVEKYETRSGRWTFVPPMLSERYGQGFTALNGQLYACGGGTASEKCTTSAEVYDPIKNNWLFISSMKSARSLFKLLPYCGKLYAIGGSDEQSKRLGVVEIYDPGTGEWISRSEIDPTYFVSADVMTASPTG